MLSFMNNSLNFILILGLKIFLCKKPHRFLVSETEENVDWSSEAVSEGKQHNFKFKQE